MASWKKVLVSGSAGEFTSVTASAGVLVGTNQTIGTAQSTTRLTGSFTGSFTGDGSGLTGVTATFPISTVASLDATDKFFIQDSADNVSKYITYNDFLGDIAGNGLVVDPASPNSTQLKVDDNLNITTVTAVGSPIGFIGNITGSNVIGTVNPASYALPSSYSLTASYALNSIGGTLNISASDNTNTSINLKDEALIVSGTLNEIEVTANAANNLLQIGLPNNVTIAGTLTVNGTVTTVSSSNLVVADKFILLSSGSTNNNDGGIIVQNAASNNTGSGYGLFLEGQGFTGAVGTPAPRWGVTSSISQFAQNSATPDEYMVTAKTVASPQTPGSTAPTYGGASSIGNGNMVIDSNGDIWIYVY